VGVDGSWANYRRDPSLWYLYRLRHQGAPVPIDVPRDPARWGYMIADGYLVDLLKGPLRGRPLCVTFFRSDAPGDQRVFFRWAAKHYQVLPIGLLVRLQPVGRRVDIHALLKENERQWARMVLPDLHGISTADELDPDYIANSYACSLVNFGGLYEMAGDRARAEALYHRAAAWAPGYQPAAAALASLRRHPPAG
jgi:hypothetical protein